MHQHFFWTNLNEIRKLSFPVLQDIVCFETTGFLSMSLNQVLELRFPMFNAYGTGHKRIHIKHFMRHDKKNGLIITNKPRRKKKWSFIFTAY